MVSVRRVAPVLLLVIATSAAFGQRQSSQPPRELHKVGDHWTAYNPPDPASYPAGARTHEIKQGDTLWGLAQTYYSNPYLWPQLWEANTWITDAHWIYPGDVLLIEGEGAMQAVEANTAGTTESGGVTLGTGRESDVFAAETGSGIPVARMNMESRPLALATEADIYCYGYIGDPNEPMPNFIASHENIDVKYVPGYIPSLPGSATTGDLVFVHGDASTGLVAGETYLLVLPEVVIPHPVTHQPLGMQYDYIGQARVLCTEDGRSRAVIVQACREIPIGTRLKPLPQLPIPIARVPELPQWCDPPTGKTSGYIVDSRGWELGMVEGTLVQVDLGRDDQLQPGDFLTVSRPSEHPDQPMMVLGQLGVLTTESRTATAIVISVRRELHIGDRVELR